MIKTLYEIGNALQDNYPEYFTPWQNPFSEAENRQQKERKVIQFDVTDGKLSLKPHITDFTKENIDKYLYRKLDGAQGTNLVPTFVYYFMDKEDENTKFIPKHLVRVFRSIQKNQTLFSAIGFVKADELQQLETPLLELNKTLSIDCQYLFTITLNGKYLGEYKEVLEMFKQNAYERYYRSSKATQKLCAVTYQTVEEVWGSITTLGFTVNDIAFSRNGFEDNQSYKMFGVAPYVAKTLEGAMSLLEDRIKQRFAHLFYFVLPHFVNPNPQRIKQAMKGLIDATLLPLSSAKQAILSNERLLHRIIEKDELSSNDIYYDLFFYERDKSSLLVKLHLADVLPSRLKKIFTVKQQIEESFAGILNYRIEKQDKDIEFALTFDKMKPYFVGKDFHPYFYTIIERVFCGGYLNEQQIIKAFVNTIETAFKNRSDPKVNYSTLTKISFAIYQFFYSLGLFKHNLPIMTEQTNAPVAQTAEEFVNQNPHFFNNDYKKGVFLLGCLTRTLTDKQYQKLKNEPFFKYLNRLHLSENDIAKLLPKLINKLREYEITLPSIEGQIALYLTQPCNITTTDISYAFTLGLVMQREFKKAFFADKEQETEAVSE